MKLTTATLLTSVIITLLPLVTTVAQDKKDSPVTQITKEDQYHLRAINAELVTIQDQINRFAEQVHAQDKVKERAELMTRICGVAKIPTDSCNVDSDTGKVTENKKVTPVGSTTLPPK